MAWGQACITGYSTEIRDPLINRTEFEYDPQGSVTRVIDRSDEATVFVCRLQMPVPTAKTL